MGHHRTKQDDIVAYYLFKHSGKAIGLSQKEITQTLGISEASLQMRVANFQALDGPGGLSKASRLSYDVYSEYRNISKEAHFKEVQQILQEKSLWPGAA